MKVVYNPDLLKTLNSAPITVQNAFFKQIEILTQNLRQPSLRAKKYNAAGGLWQARVNKD